MVATRQDWDRPRNVSKALIYGLDRSIKLVRRFSGKLRRKNYVYEPLALSSSDAKCNEVVEFAGDGNEIFGWSYSVGDDFNYRIIKFTDIEEGDLSSSYRELLVLFDCIKNNRSKKLRGKDLVYYTDSRVLYFWYKNGTTNATVAEKLIQIGIWCFDQDIILEVVWKPRDSQEITLADTSCRTDTDEFSLPRHVYDFLTKHFKLEIKCDLFGSTLLHKAEFFYSKVPTCGSSGSDALKFDWNNLVSYCHPPKTLLYKVYKKIEASKYLDLLLIVLKTKHNNDFKLFLVNDNEFKSYVQGIVQFQSTVHCPHEPTKFMIGMHSWYALKIVKRPNKHFHKTMNDIFYFK